MGITAAETAQNIEVLVKQGIRKDLRPDEVISQGSDSLALEILSSLQANLDDELRRKYRPHADRFAVPYPTPVADCHIAKAWLWHEMVTAGRRITLERYIRNQFEDSLLFEMFPELRGQCDAEGLLPAELFKSKRQLGHAVIYKNHAIRLSEAMPYELETRLVGIATSGTNKSLKIRLSHYAIQPVSKFHDPMLKAIVRGPSFAERFVTEKLHTRNQTTILQRIPMADEERRLWATLDPIERFEVNRSEKGNYVSLMAEQLNPATPRHGSPGNYVTNPLFHSDLELGGKEVVFKHADASVLIYEFNRYAERLALNLPDTMKAAGHFKLFWVGDCSLSVWKELFRETFPENELVAEFFTGQRCSPWSVDPIS